MGRKGPRTPPKPQTAGKGGLCFIAGTQVATEDGLRNIEDVQIGDLVRSRSDDTGEEALKPVTHLFVTHPVELIHLSYRRESGSSGEDPDSKLIGTRVHPFWSVDRAAWVDMGDLRPGERLRLLDGSFATVTRVQVEHAPCADPAWQPGMAGAGTLGTAADPQTGTFTTYNFEVATWHTYFATPAKATARQATWVHNLNVGPCNPNARDFIKDKLHKSGMSRTEKRAALDQFIEQQKTQAKQVTKAAEAKYPKKAGKSEDHHVDPKYMGGDPKGTTSNIPAAYHQEITNEFRRRYPYGQPKLPAHDRRQIMEQVYSRYPLFR